MNIHLGKDEDFSEEEEDEDEPGSTADKDEDEYNLRMFGISQALPVPDGPPVDLASGAAGPMHARSAALMHARGLRPSHVQPPCCMYVCMQALLRRPRSTCSGCGRRPCSARAWCEQTSAPRS